jgi:hypothetical protein
MKLVFYFAILITLKSCTSIDNNIAMGYNSNSIFKNDTFQNKIKTYFADGKLDLSVDTNLKGEKFGNRYEFYHNGILKNYFFQIDSLHESYSISYDSTGKQIETNGSPIVYRLVSADEAKDTMYVRYYVSDFAYKKLEFLVSDSFSAFRTLTPIKDSGEKIANLKIYEYWKDISNKKRFVMIARFEGFTADNNFRLYTDSVDLSRR